MHLPDTEAPESITVELTDEWQTYEISLSEFPNTDLKTLITPLGFVFEQKPQAFRIRNARYEKSD